MKHIIQFIVQLFLFLFLISLNSISKVYAIDIVQIDINTGAGDSLWYTYGFIDLNGVGIFSADDGVNGEELWRSDGTEVGTKMVKNIRTGSDSSSPKDYIKINNAIYFSACDDDNACFYESLWKTDGTESGTKLVKDIEITNAQKFNVNGTLVFFADDGVHGEELWKSDGTELGTTMIQDLTPGSDGSFTYNAAKVVGNKLLFVIGSDLWVTDGTIGGTSQITSDLTVSESGFRYSSVYDGYVYFSAENATYGNEVWRSDGTTIGTSLVKDIVAGSEGINAGPFISFNNQVYFWTWDDELYKTDGSEANTIKVHDMNYYTDWDLDYMVEIENDLYFVGEDRDGYYGDELWKIDGDTGISSMVKDIYTGSGDSDIEFLTAIDGKLYFSGTDDSEGGWNTEPWISDGTSDGTEMLANINTDYDEGSYPEYFMAIGDMVFFTGYTNEYGTELYALTPSVSLSNDPSLSDIVITGFSLSPSFSSEITSYTLSVPSSTTSIFFTGTKSVLESTMKVNDTTVDSGETKEIPLVLGVNEIKVDITAEDGVTKQTYTLLVTRILTVEEEENIDQEQEEDEEKETEITNNNPNIMDENIEEEDLNQNSLETDYYPEKSIDKSNNSIKEVPEDTDTDTSKDKKRWWLIVLFGFPILLIIFLLTKKKESQNY